MTKRELLTAYREAVIELEELRRQIKRVGTDGRPSGVRCAQTDSIHGTNDPQSAALQLADGLEALLARRENELRELGRKMRWHKAFPKGANVNFYEITGEDTLYERTFERGVEDFTYACGTGTGSVVAALTLQGKVSGCGVNVDMTGGRLVIDAEREGSAIRNLYLTGPTNIVAKGEITDEDLDLAK